MKQLSNIEQKYNLEDFLYSEITALVYFNPLFFDFLKDEKYKYLMNNSVFNNELLFEYPKHNITFKSKIEVNIEEHWNFLQKCYDIGTRLKSVIVSTNNIVVYDDYLVFVSDENHIVFRDKNKEDMITLNDFETLFKTDINSLYNKNIDSYCFIFINHLKNYLKPQYLYTLNYFLEIFYDKNLEINWNNYKNFKVDGLGIRNDSMEGLYYNNLANFCKDVIVMEDAFRDYNLMISAWKEIKNNTLNKEYLLSIIKDKITEEDFIFLITKFYSLGNEPYYRYEKGELLFLPSKNDFIKNYLSDYKISYKTNNNKDIIICIDFSKIELRLKFSIGDLAPYGFCIEIVSINKKSL